MYRNATDFCCICVLILKPATLPDSLMHSRNFLVASSGSSMYSTILSVNSDSFPIWVPFIYFSSLRVDILVFFLILEEMFSPFTIEHDVSCKFVTYGLYYIEVCSLYAYFLEGFIINVFWILSKAFLCIYWDVYFLFLSLLMLCIILIDLQILKKSLHTWAESSDHGAWSF